MILQSPAKLGAESINFTAASLSLSLSVSTICLILSETLTEGFHYALTCSGVEDIQIKQDVISGLKVLCPFAVLRFTEEKAGQCKLGTHDGGKALSSVQKSDPQTAFTVISSDFGACVTASDAENCILRESLGKGSEEKVVRRDCGAD